MFIDDWVIVENPQECVVVRIEFNDDKGVHHIVQGVPFN